MTTGTDIKRILEAKYDKTYSAFLSPAKQNDLLKEALILSVRDVYKELSDQVDYDDLIGVIRTEQIFGINNNSIYVGPIPVVSIGSGLTPIVVTLLPHNLIAGDSVEFSNVSGITTTPDINTGTFAITIIDATSFSIVLTANTGTHITNTGRIDAVSAAGIENKLIGDYGDLLAIKTKYSQTLNLKITNAKNTQPIRVKVDKRNNIKTGEQINIGGVAGNTNANGDFYVKVINSYEFDLYKDRDLQNGVNGNGVSGGSGKVKRIYYKTATPYFSSRKISSYEEPSISLPKFERADLMLKIYPNDRICEEITADYIRYDLTFIDVANSNLDMELFYPYEFLSYITDKAAKMFFERTKDFESYQVAAIQEQQNK